MDYLYGFSVLQPGGMATLNVDDGYLEGLCRGYRSGILKTTDYANLTQCDILDDMKLHLAQTDYGDFLANESKLTPTLIAEKCREKLINEFFHLRAHAVQPLATFLDYITYGYMIDNIVLLITGTLHERDTSELIEKCHPLGMFDAMATLSMSHNVSDLYHSVLVDTPLAPYFVNCLSEEDLDEMNIELIRNTLFKAYLEDFYQYCQTMGGTTAEVMGDLLKFEADRRSITITINSFGTELTKDDREKLYPEFGFLYPEGIARLTKAEDIEQVRGAIDYCGAYRNLFQETSFNADKSLEDAFFEYEVELNKLAFEQQFHYGIYYSYLKLKEQEIRNIVWISECVAQSMKSQINQYIPIF